jgi:hypothetical protein
MSEAASKPVRVPSEFFEWIMREEPFKGQEVRILAQPAQAPAYVDVEFRDGQLVRGPFRIPFDSLRWKGPR